MKLTIRNPDLNIIDRAFYEYIIQHNKKYDYYLVKGEFKSVFFKKNQFCPNNLSTLSDNKTKNPWSIFLEKVFNDFKEKGYTFNHFEEMNILTIAIKMDMSFDFYIKHNMHAVEWK